ncbi:hypothetical protein EOD14_33845 [Mesorhizobium sp. M7A.T.Ca.US.000.02.1.1]|uniref:hypothetical protein n=3 Tax=unclassified Mesorhizobium TaxID=325217 RepID=UPI000FD4E12E|nr:hypothetical protein [Mesorhizobium sp. M7A.T.Ca.US.000.02.1.1]RUT80349.1 hypothetical protein EOD14_33845 [Mesorhizobium sp. M7A.T.Ca.US.000.02.1.1]
MAEAEIDKAMIVNWALVELGLAPNFSIDTETKLGGLVDIFWPRAIARTFGLHDWTFCRQTFVLTRQDAAPINGWTYGYDLPGGILGPPLKLTTDALCERPLRDFALEGKSAFANEPVVYARCKLALDPVAWPPQFADGFAMLLASYLAIPLTQDAELKADKEAAAIGTPSTGGSGGLFGRLIAQDRAGSPVGSPASTDVLQGGRASSEPWHGRW